VALTAPAVTLIWRFRVRPILREQTFVYSKDLQVSIEPGSICPVNLSLK